jgi:hypothetical protein
MEYNNLIYNQSIDDDFFKDKSGRNIFYDFIVLLLQLVSGTESSRKTILRQIWSKREDEKVSTYLAIQE